MRWVLFPLQHMSAKQAAKSHTESMGDNQTAPPFFTQCLGELQGRFRNKSHNEFLSTYIYVYFFVIYQRPLRTVHKLMPIWVTPSVMSLFLYGNPIECYVKKGIVTLTQCRTYKYCQYKISWWPMVIFAMHGSAKKSNTSGINHCYSGDSGYLTALYNTLEPTKFLGSTKDY